MERPGSPSFERMLGRHQRNKAQTRRGDPRPADLIYEVTYKARDPQRPAHYFGHDTTRVDRSNIGHHSGGSAAAPDIVYDTTAARRALAPRMHGAVRFEHSTAAPAARPRTASARPRTALSAAAEAVGGGYASQQADLSLRFTTRAVHDMHSDVSRERRARLATKNSHLSAELAPLNIRYHATERKKYVRTVFFAQSTRPAEPQHISVARAATPGNSEEAGDVHGALSRTRKKLHRDIGFARMTGRDNGWLPCKR